MNEATLPGSALPIEARMSAILATAFAILVGLHSVQVRRQPPRPRKGSATTTTTPPSSSSSSFYDRIPIQLPDPCSEPSKYCYEVFAWRYTVVWIGIFGFVVVSGCYELFDEWGYLGLCGGLALPLLLQPILYPAASSPVASVSDDGGGNTNTATIVVDNPDIRRPFRRRYSSKATLYLATYSFIGNYWYTHYFYNVLRARYTMPAQRLNDVPIAMYLATHFYFCTYHACVGNGFLRYVDRSYEDDAAGGGGRKRALFWFTVLFLSYFTAFMETLTISSFPYYSFEDRTMAYVWGSAFYGIYFLVSFPGFYYFDSHVDEGETPGKKDEPSDRAVTLIDTLTTACGHGMMILCILDFVRLYLGIPLVIGGVAFATTT